MSKSMFDLDSSMVVLISFSCRQVLMFRDSSQA